jgi:class 3 adenylate cyclase
VCEVGRRDRALLDRLGLPTVIHYCGHVAEHAGGGGRFPVDEQRRVADEITAHLKEHDVRIAYGSLASGADILVAEAVLARGGELRVVLPFGAEEFADVSVAPAGASWMQRFERCLERATGVFVACDSAYGGDDELFLHASRIAMGMAHNRAAVLATPPRQLAVWDGQPARGPGGTADDIAAWRHIGNRTHVIDLPARTQRREAAADEGPTVRTVRAFIFADLHGFSQLRDEHFPVALRHVFAPLADVLTQHEPDVLYRNTWGDGLHVVLPSAAAAARCALDLQDALRDVDAHALGLPASLRLRVAVHVGPVMSLPDPVLDAPGWWGRELTRTARIEPRTPEGEVYATEQFAAMLVLEPDSGATCEYVGRVTTAKAFETIPMYRIGRSHQ